MTATSFLFHDLLSAAADRDGDRPAVTVGATTLSYAALATQVGNVAGALHALPVAKGDRAAIYLDKRIETLATMFGASAAGAVFVPVNPVLKAEQVAHILRDCSVRVLVTTAERLASLEAVLPACTDLRHVVLVGAAAELPRVPNAGVHRWSDLAGHSGRAGHRVIDGDIVSILYTSGSTGRPKGVVLSHRNMVTGAKSVGRHARTDVCGREKEKPERANST